MPIERRNRQQQLSGLLIGLALAVFAITMGYALVRAANRGDFALQLGDDTFNAGNVRALAPRVAEAPLLFSDVSGNGQQRPIFITHEGRVNTEGWHAFLAVAPGTDDCYLEWRPADERFGADCTEDTYGRHGEGLVEYRWTLDDDDNLVVDMRTDDDSTTTSTTTTASSGS